MTKPCLPNHFILALAAGLLSGPTLNAQSPETIHYQGKVSVGGEAFSGTGSFKFALVDGGTENVSTAAATANVTDQLVISLHLVHPGNGYDAAKPPKVTISGGGGSGAEFKAIVEDGVITGFDRLSPGDGYTSTPDVDIVAPEPATKQTLWSHDGSGSGGSEPSTAIALPVSQGVFSVNLGDLTFDGMSEPITAELLQQGPRMLRVWFDDGTGFSQLAPDQPLSSVPYALRANSAVQAESVTDGAIGIDQIDSSIGLWTNSGGTFTSNNYVGINTNSPSQALDVDGNIEVNGWMGTAQDQPLQMRVANETVMRIEPRFLNDDFRPNITLGAPSNDILGSITRGVTISGGRGNTVSGNDSTIGGGWGNTASSTFTTIGGGENNATSGTRSTVSGGGGNTGSGSYSSIGGGRGNEASNFYSTAGGGLENTASGSRAVVSGGDKNVASGSRATVGGGLENTASGTAATVPGGIDNIASGSYSFAAGQRANAAHNGAFVWGGGGEFASTDQNQFLIRADGGVGIGTNTPAGALHVMGNTAVGGFAEDYRLGVGTSNPWNTLHVVSNDDQGPFRVAVGSNSNTAFRVYPNLGAGIGNSWNESVVPSRGLRVYGRTISDGRTGARTTTPRASLHVKGDRSTIGMILESSESENGWGIGTSNNTGSLQFFYMNDVAGSSITTAFITTDGDYNSFSDKRLKHDIQPLESILSDVLSLEPVSYRLNNSADEDSSKYGFVAQDVQAIFPELVSENDEHLGLAYSKFSVLAIQAIQEQQNLIEAQKETVDSQAAELASLRKRVEAVENLEEHIARLEDTLTKSGLLPTSD